VTYVRRELAIIRFYATVARNDIGNGVSLDKVDKFCYLGDMLDADGGRDSAVTTRVRSAWKKFREYLPILTAWKRILVKTERQCICYLCEELYDAWQRDHVIHPLLPPPKAPGYNLRKRSHGLPLPTTQSNLLRKHFVYRMLFKDIY